MNICRRGNIKLPFASFTRDLNPNSLLKFEFILWTNFFVDLEPLRLLAQYKTSLAAAVVYIYTFYTG